MAAKGGSWKSGKFIPAGTAVAGRSSVDRGNISPANPEDFDAAVQTLPDGTRIQSDNEFIPVNTYTFSVAGSEVEFESTRLGLSRRTSANLIDAQTNRAIPSRNARSARNIDFTVDGGFLQRGDRDSRSGTRIAIGVRRVMNAELAAQPIGTIFSTSAAFGDGLGQQRVNAYRRMGFGTPRTNGEMFARSARENGRIVLRPLEVR